MTPNRVESVEIFQTNFLFFYFVPQCNLSLYYVFKILTLYEDYHYYFTWQNNIPLFIITDNATMMLCVAATNKLLSLISLSSKPSQLFAEGGAYGLSYGIWLQSNQ